MGTAGGCSLVATEARRLPLHGWAMATGAVNLLTGEVTVDERSEEQRLMLRDFADQLYNGWSHPQVGRRASAHDLPLLATSGMTYEVFIGSMIAADPRHLDSTRHIGAMMKALPPEWRAQATGRSTWGPLG